MRRLVTDLRVWLQTGGVWLQFEETGYRWRVWFTVRGVGRGAGGVVGGGGVGVEGEVGWGWGEGE